MNFFFLSCVEVGYNHDVKHGDNICDIFLTLFLHI
jgi:hypothetical protein